MRTVCKTSCKDTTARSAMPLTKACCARMPAKLGRPLLPNTPLLTCSARQAGRYHTAREERAGQTNSWLTGKPLMDVLYALPARSSRRGSTMLPAARPSGAGRGRTNGSRCHSRRTAASPWRGPALKQIDARCGLSRKGGWKPRAQPSHGSICLAQDIPVDRANAGLAGSAGVAHGEARTCGQGGRTLTNGGCLHPPWRRRPRRPCPRSRCAVPALRGMPPSAQRAGQGAPPGH